MRRIGMRWSVAVWVVAAAVAGGAGAQSAGVQGPLELTNGLGRRLYALPEDATVAAARKRLAADPKSSALVLALSKAQAGRRQYREAVATDTVGLAADPKNAELLLERGHRELGLRQFGAARKDLEQAQKISPETVDVYYHLALSHFFVGEFAEAAVWFGKGRDLAKSMDTVIDYTAWLYASLRRAGKEAEAAEALTKVGPEVTATGHIAIYLGLVRFYQGKVGPMEERAPKPSGPDDLEGELSYNTTSFGVGNWYIYQGHDEAKAKQIFREVVENGQAWNAWGFIGSEVELGRKKK